MTRLRDRMDRLVRDGKTALVIYLTHGDPSPAESVDIVERAAEAGADVIEMGVPFSDPNADGVVIQQAMERARAAGAGLHSALDAVRELRERGCEVPVVLFGYYNPIFVMGAERFAKEAKRAGVDAVLTVDLPIEEIEELRAPLRAEEIDVVPLVAPTSGAERIGRTRALRPPFVYYVSMTGVTGAAFAQATVDAERIEQVRALTGAPVTVGFGIKTPEDARRVAAYADGVVVGTALIRKATEAGPGKAAEAVAGLVAELRKAVDEEDGD
jgi:tryptophan synthase alpha chain